MIRMLILGGMALMLLELHVNGNLNKYINLRYAYLSIIAIILLTVLFIIEGKRVARMEKEAEDAKKNKHSHTHVHEDGHDHVHHDGHACHCEDHGHDHKHSKLGHTISCIVLIIPIITGLFLPVQTLDSSFLKAKGFSFPDIDYSADNPGNHQFLKPDTSIFYGEEGYKKVANRELSQFIGQQQIIFNDDNYLKGLEALYNNPNNFMDRTIGFDGFVYKGEQIDDSHYFVFRYGFIHCAADSGVFGMLVEFPKGTDLNDDNWVHVAGTLSLELYHPFKQTIPVLKVKNWNAINKPSDPYVYRNF